MKKLYLYPIWLRIWHWLNALLFLILILSGISLHYSESGSLLVPFSVAILAHNISGILLSLNYAFFIIWSVITGNIKHYIPRISGLWGRIFIQTKFYLLGIFDRDPHPYHPTLDNKFNPMQQLTYLSVMFLLMPIIVVSGWLLLFPEYSPEDIFGMGGVWPMAMLHTIVGFFLSVFMFAHIYLATTGSTVGELFKSMLNGWHLIHEEEIALAEKQVKPERVKEKGKLFPAVFYNPTTLTGAFMALTSIGLIILLMVLEYFSDRPNPYMGIITFVILPSFLILGLLLIAFGMFKENRRLLRSDSRERKLPVIDLNNPKHQIATLVFSLGTVLLIVFSTFGSFKAYEYTDSDQFCGEVCHKVMEPEYTAYKSSPHSHVGCVKCHIGPGADWFVRSKLSGSYQVYSVLANAYSKPIPTPVENLRPAQQTCEQCHWPKHFYNETKMSFSYFLSDEQNSNYSMSMIVKVGGGNPEFGNTSGIHWAMNLANEITYLAVDRERQNIPWVKSRSLITGKETIYKLADYNIPDEMLKSDKLRKFDCIDCHNRPSHIYNPPAEEVNKYMEKSKIDPNIPYMKNIAVQAMESHVTTKKTAYNDIRDFVWDFYKNSYPQLNQDMKTKIDKAIDQIHQIYQRNYFPDMKVSWKSFPNNIGHKYSPGCFRCHDGKHVSDDGKVISNDCQVCHTIVSQKAPNQQMEESTSGLNFNHPGGIDKLIKTHECYSCHGRFAKSTNKVNPLSSK